MNQINTELEPKPGVINLVLTNIRRHPRGFWYIFSGEFAERASNYGVIAIMASYLQDVLHYSDAGGSKVVHAFKAICYLLPLLGAWIADRWLGKFWTIILFSLPYILGHVLLGHYPTNLGLILALSLLAIGTGAIKPNVAPLMQLMYDEQKKSDSKSRKPANWNSGLHE
jgi:POT family proton-dependent oligopeptide transporter